MKKSILIFGASSGIGKASAEHFSRNGWNVFAVARRAERLAELAKNYPAIQTKICDIGDEKQVKDVFAWIAKQGKVDAILHSAGAGFITDVPLEQTDMAVWQESWNVNATGTLIVATGAKLLFAKQGSGLFVGIGSRASLNQDVLGGRVSYSASKHAQLAIVETLHAELVTEKIPARAIIVCPGFIPGTEMVREWEARHKSSKKSGTSLSVATGLIFRLVDDPEGHPGLIYLLDDRKLTRVPKYNLTGA